MVHHSLLSLDLLVILHQLLIVVACVGASVVVVVPSGFVSFFAQTNLVAVAVAVAFPFGTLVVVVGSPAPMKGVQLNTVQKCGFAVVVGILWCY